MHGHQIFWLGCFVLCLGYFMKGDRIRIKMRVTVCIMKFYLNMFQAVYYLKSSKHLNLLVLKGVACDLFPGESSGYNSSASSLNGDTHVSCLSESSTSSPVATTGMNASADILVHPPPANHNSGDPHHSPSPKRLSMVTEENPMSSHHHNNVHHSSS